MLIFQWIVRFVLEYKGPRATKTLWKKRLEELLYEISRITDYQASITKIP